MNRNKIQRMTLTLAVGAFIFLAVSGAAGAAGPNGIVKPTEGAMISGPIRVQGIAAGPDFAAYQLDMLPLGNDQTSYSLGQGTVPVEIPDAIGHLDSALYPDGDYRLRLRVITKDGNFTQYFTSLTIANGPLPRIGITDPLPGARLACLATVKGVGRDNDFRKQQVDLLLGGAEDKTVYLGRNARARTTPGTLTQFDTTQFPDGEQILRLRVVRQDGNYDEYFTRIIIDNSVMATALNQKACGCGVPDPEASPAGPNGISYPQNGTTVRGVIPICGIAADPNFSAWDVNLLFDKDERKATLMAYDDRANPTRNPFTMLDTTALPDGKYGLRLRVSRADGTVDQSMISVCIANHTSQSPGQTCN